MKRQGWRREPRPRQCPYGLPIYETDCTGTIVLAPPPPHPLPAPGSLARGLLCIGLVLGLRVARGSRLASGHSL